MLREMTLEVLLPTCTDWGLLARKSGSQVHRGMLKQRGASLLTRCCRDDGVEHQA